MLRKDEEGDSSATAPSRQQVEAQLHRILDSSVFRNAPRHSRFLQFVVNQTLAGKAEEVKEHVIGLEVFDRASDYDPGSDPIVRAEARRLRSRLADYYQQFGQRDAVHIELPKGTYVPVFLPNGVADPDTPSAGATEPSATTPPELGPLSSSPAPEAAAPAQLKSRRRWVPLVVAVAMVVAAGFAIHWLKPRTHAKPAADVATLPNLVVLSDFTNTTGDPIFRPTLRQALATQLEQSPFINLLPEPRIAQTLALMSQPKDARLTRRLTREICQRVAGMASIEGSIALQGSHYLVGLEAVDCRTGKTMATAEATADSKQHVLSALRQAATSLRRGIGESMASVSRYDVPPENATTASLEALQAYSSGCHAMIALGDYEAAIPFFQKAIKLDPNFAMAYARLGTSYENVGQSNLGPENLRKAYALRQRVSDRERFYIDSHYYEIVTGDLVAARAVYELWAQTYPADDIPLIALGRAYTELGDYEKSLAAYQKALSLNGGSGLLYANLIFTYVSLNRLDEARATAKEAQRLHFDSPWNNFYLYWADFIQHDPAGMARELAPDAVKPDTADLVFYIEASTAAYGGQMAKAADLAQRAADIAKHADQKDAAAGYLAINAVHEALAGETELAKQHATAAGALSSQREVQAVTALAWALNGDTHQAMQVATDLSNRYPEDTWVQLIHLPTIRGAVALQDGNGAKAVEALAPAAPYELGRGDVIWLYPVFIRAQAYLAARQSTAAVAEFQSLLDHPGLVLNDPIGALAHLGLARAYVQSGDTAKAKTAYQDFLALWKDADPELPLLQQAQLEYSRLP